MDKETEQLIIKYRENAKIQMDCTYSGNYRKGNRASDKLYKYNKMMKEDRELACEIIDVLISDRNPNVVIWMSGVAIELHYREQEIIARMKEIANNQKLGIIGFDAKMSLKVHGIEC